ncbi:hypothetical protein BLNAU_21076 [Blattamonas nauphoetae]|uniref:Protein kinase domain-containing protein n=1 Tax=Blattamonas nauphoetae TaxID=2049346 RepID=A0ABQ9WWW9_9EUKA|nr:hypothetical protein BLNAU_21076 [Blattamonas nauphoetae]
MVVESIVGEGETVHEKTLVLRTNTNGKIEPISVKLYPREDDATKLKGQLEFGTRYYVKRIEEGSTEIHIETAASTFLTPEEPIRIEGADSSLGDSKEKAGVVEFWGVGLSSGKGYTLKVQKESSSGVLSGGVIELVGTLTVFGSESGRFSHTEEIFGVSAARISYGSSYAIVGIVVGGVEGVVNKKVGFSVPDEPCRLTKMTGSEFTDAEKTKMELSFETHALSANTDYSMVVESIVGEGETVHEKTLVLRTNTNGKIEPISVKLYPREDDATKLKGQLEFGTRNGSSVWIPLTPMAIVNDTHCSVEFPVGKDENTSTLAFGKKYTLQRDGGSAHFVVMSGIVVSVPNPPSLHDIHFSFANDLNTSCVVEVAGSDLLPSTEYNVTLNSTLFVIVHFSSSTKGMSGETQIGWEGLQFVTEYTVTSIQPLNEDDGDILLLETVSGETGKRPSSFNIFTDSSSLEESPFCGDLERACSSISEVWKIVSGLVIVRPTIEIVDSVRMKEGIRIVGGMHVVIRNGTSSEPSLIVPSSFSLDSLSAVIVVEATGFLELRNVDVWIESSDPSFVFISATQATIILREGIITGPKSSPTQNEEETEDCLTPGYAVFGTSLQSFSSFRRNLICSGNGSIDVRSPRGGDGTTESPSAWIITDGCSMEGDGLKLVSPFFIPTLSNTSTSSFDKKEALYEIEMEGSTLIPSLKPELEWRGRLVFGEEQRTNTTFVIQPNRIEKLSQSLKDNMKWWLPLVIVVAVALLVLILLIVVCVWRRKKNGRKEGKEPLMLTQEMEVEKYEEVEEDLNAPTAHVSSVRGLNGNTLNVGHWTENERSETRKIAEEKEEREIAFENRVCGLSCGEKDGVVEVVDKTETLYRRLHVLKIGVDQRWAQLSVARGLSRAMKMSQYSAILTELTSHSVVLSGERTMSLILKSDTTQPDPLTEQPTQQNEETRENRNGDDELTDNSLHDTVDETVQKPTPSRPAQIVRPHPLRQSEVHRDDVRWQAPEEEEGGEEGRKTNEGEVGKSIDRTKASVFRLGLVLWEIETGLVPFAEQDGVNAHRNMSIGIMPPMEGIGEKMKELIEECLSVNPDERPSVDSIISRLSSMDGKASAQKAQHIALS